MKSLPAVVIVVTISALALWIGSAFTMVGLFGRPCDAASAGDMFGAVNALFSGLAFAGVVIALVLQGRDLSLQGKQLNASARLQALSTLVDSLERRIQRLLDAIDSGEKSEKSRGALKHLTSERKRYLQELEDIYKALYEEVPGGRV